MFCSEKFKSELLFSLAKEYGTPYYLYDAERIRDNYTRLYGAFSCKFPNFSLLYALKANTNLTIVDLLKKEGAEAECISPGETSICMDLGYKGEEILYTSSSKSATDLEHALTNNITINIDSNPELDLLLDICRKSKKKARVMLRLNPDIIPRTHPHLATGHKLTKFGFIHETGEVTAAVEKILDAGIKVAEICGIHSHIGSQILEHDSLVLNASYLGRVQREIHEKLAFKLPAINLGGGTGIPYTSEEAPVDISTLSENIKSALQKEGVDLEATLIILEAGRYLTGDSGVLVSSINSVKTNPERNFINVDTGFNQFLRPILYSAHHEVSIFPKDKESAGKERIFDIAGNICETGDILASKRTLPTPVAGDLVAFLNAGAYCFALASEYNSFPLPPEILIDGNKEILIRSRGSQRDILRNQTFTR